MCLEEMKSYLRIRGLKVNGRKNRLVAKVFAASKNGIKPIKTAVQVEADLKTKYLAKLKIDSRNIATRSFQNSSWMDEQRWGMVFSPMLLYPDIFNYLKLFSSEIGSNELNDYKKSKAYNYHK